MLREIIRRLDVQDLDNQAGDHALNYIFAENKMTNGVNYLDKKLKTKNELLSAYAQKKKNDKK